MNELNEKLIKWVGWKYETCSDKPPDFPNDLNACFKWLVPKALDYITTTMFEGISTEKAREALLMFWLRHWNKGKTPALALCFAIEKLVR